MSLRITELKLLDFRSFEDLHLPIEEDLVIILGPNAAGKTNLMEALSVLTSGESFRTSSMKDLIRVGKKRASARLHYQGDVRSLDVIAELEKRKSFKLNGKPIRTEELRKLVPSVSFTPNDLDLVKRGSSLRREALDRLGVILHPNYVEFSRAYERALIQRNSVLKDQFIDEAVLAAWTENLVINGTLLTLYRRSLFERLIPFIQEAYARLSPAEDVDGSYESSIEGAPSDKEGFQEAFHQRIRENSEEERMRGMTLIGPQRDDVRLTLDGRDIRNFGSQGQQRTMVLAWKMAEMKAIEDYLGQVPILLLDDVMSELDEHRRAELLSFVDGRVQTFISSTTVEYFPDEVLSRAQVVRLGG